LVFQRHPPYYLGMTDDDETWTPDEEAWTRADWARWFVEHDDVDEAAHVLQPGDGLFLGHSDYLSLDAALVRRGLSATYHLGRVRVNAATSDSAMGARRPPVRATPAVPTAAKRSA
jgi:hypothetical protein